MPGDDSVEMLPLPLEIPTIDRIHVPDEGIEMYRMKRAYRADGSRLAEIVELPELWRPVELIANYGEACDIRWTKDTSTELADELWVNCFHNKESYQSTY